MQNNHIFLKSSSDDIKKFTTSRNKKNLKKTYINPLSAKPTNGQTHSNNSSPFTDELFEYIWPFCEVGA